MANRSEYSAREWLRAWAAFLVFCVFVNSVMSGPFKGAIIGLSDAQATFLTLFQHAAVSCVFATLLPRFVGGTVRRVLCAAGVCLLLWLAMVAFSIAFSYLFDPKSGMVGFTVLIALIYCAVAAAVSVPYFARKDRVEA